MNTTTNARTRMRGRRGVAMLMVVIALVVTTVLTTAILTSPDRMGPIADNARASAEARWSAASAANFTTAAIEQQVRAETIGGLYKSDWAVGAGMANVMVTNASGDPVTASDREVYVTVTSEAGGVMRTTQMLMEVEHPREGSEIADTRLGEITIYAVKSFEADKSKIANWWLSPEAGTGETRVALGFDNAGAAAMFDSQLAGTLVMPVDAGASLRTWAQSAGAAGYLEIPVVLPSGNEPMPSLLGVVEHVVDTMAKLLSGILRGGWGDRISVVAENGAAETIEPGRYRDMWLDNGGTITLGDGVYVFDDVDIRNGSRLDVRGDAVVVVTDGCRIESGSDVLIAEDASLRLWVEDTLTVRDSVIGPWEGLAADSGRHIKNVDGYMTPSRVVIDANNDAVVRIRNGSIVLANIHAPGAMFRVDGAALVGRVTAGDVRLKDAIVLYDPTMDPRVGFTNLNGPLYQNNGQPIPGLVALLAVSKGNAPDVARESIADLLEDYWTAEGRKVSHSGYTSVRKTAMPVDTMTVERDRGELDKLSTVKDRYLTAEAAKNTAASDTLSNLRPGR